MRKIIFIIAIFVITSSACVKSQTVYSPYSNYGFGNLLEARNPAVKSMGKHGYAFRDNTVINFMNPASYTSFDTISFVFEASVDVNSLTLATVQSSERNTYAGLGQIQMGFPIWKYIKASAGLIPMSNIGYSVENTIIDDFTGKKKYIFQGKGGVNAVYGGLGFQLWNISLGMNASFLFGNVDRNQSLMLPDSAYYFNTKRLEQISMKDVMFDIGLQYYTKLNDNYFLSLGISYRPQQNIRAEATNVSYTYTISSTGSEILKDTIFVINDPKSNVRMPHKVGGGIMLKKLNHFKLQADVDWSQWSQYSDIANPVGSLSNSVSTSVGFEFSPRNAAGSSYWKWIKYRAGMYYNNANFVVNNSKINQFGMTFGVGLPLTRSLSTINLSLDIGNRGTKANNLIQETYVNFTFGFSLYDTWFYRIKYK